jgi:hypothetical protein
MSASITTSIPTRSTTAIIPAPRSAPADEAPPLRRQRPADQYWNVFEACWCVAKACLKAADVS